MAGISLGTNILALRAQRAIARAGSLLSKGYERLSSGLRINRASDDAAGLAISENLKLKTRIYTQALRNVNDGVSALSIAESALENLSGISTRIQELASQAANGSYSSTQRTALHNEATQLVKEFNRVVQSTKFNGISLLENPAVSLAIQAGQGTNSTINLTVGAELDRESGTGQFGDATTINGSFETQLIEGDFDGNGSLDLVVATYALNRVRFLKNNGSGSFTSNDASLPIGAGGRITKIKKGDFDNDGDLDLAVLTNEAGVNRVHVMQNNGSGSFTAISSTIVSAAAGQLAVGDVNGDGKADFAIADTSFGSVAVFTNNGSSSFTQTYSTSVGGTANYQIEIGDMNGDGRGDLVVSRHLAAQLVTLINNGSGSFTSVGTITGGLDFTNFTLGDFNLDGKTDIGAIDGGVVKVYQRNASGSYSLVASASTDYSNYDIVKAADINSDGYLDLVAIRSGGESTINSFLNNQEGTAFRRVDTANGIYAFHREALTLGDFTGDGVADYATINLLTGLNTELRRGASIGTNQIAQVNLLTQADARTSLTTIQAVQTRIGAELGSVGAQLSRLQTASQVLNVTNLETQAAISRITDIDTATEVAEMVKNQILQQVASSMLAHSSTDRQIALQLLQIGPPIGPPKR